MQYCIAYDGLLRQARMKTQYNHGAHYQLTNRRYRRRSRPVHREYPGSKSKTSIVGRYPHYHRILQLCSLASVAPTKKSIWLRSLPSADALWQTATPSHATTCPHSGQIRTGC